MKGTQLLSLTVITALLLSISLLSLSSCASNRGETNPPASDNKGLILSRIPDPDKGNPKLDSRLQDLIRAEKQGQAEAFAQQRGIDLLDGGVRVIIECVPGQVEAAAKAAINVGAKQVSSQAETNWVVAVVPITSLTALTEEQSIKLIRIPVTPTY